MKTALEKKHPDLDVTERTVRNELSRLGYAAVLPKREMFKRISKNVFLEEFCRGLHIALTSIL